MSKRCPTCGVRNSDERVFCFDCGGPLDSELKLIMDLDKMAKTPHERSPRAARQDHEDDYVHTPIHQEKKHGHGWLIALLVVAAAAAAWFFFLR